MTTAIQTNPRQDSIDQTLFSRLHEPGTTLTYYLELDKTPESVGNFSPRSVYSRDIFVPKWILSGERGLDQRDGHDYFAGFKLGELTTYYGDMLERGFKHGDEATIYV